MSFTFHSTKKTQLVDIQTEPTLSTIVTQSEAPPRRFFLFNELALVVLLTIAAFIPRLILALQLDFFPDEPIYIQGGEYYFNLLTHLNFTSPNWQYNHEHPAFAKLLMGFSIYLSENLFHASAPLFPARVPSILLGTFLVVAIYLLGKNIVGRTPALLGALSLAFSPWVVFWNGQAMLDTTMMTLITLASLVLWYAIRRPRLYALCGILIGLAGASKYPAALAVPGMVLFFLYYYGFLRRTLPREEQPPLPWRWWLIGLCLIPVSFFLADPPIWLDPLHLLVLSLDFSINHADNGHLTFWAGHIRTHVPPWMIFYVLFVKVSSFVTIPAAFFSLFAVVQIVRFHLRRRPQTVQSSEQVNKIAGLAFLCIWVIMAFLCYGRLNILVGTHYYLPVAPPLFLAGTCGLTILVRSLISWLLPEHKAQTVESRASNRTPGLSWRSALTFTILLLALVGPHLIGLVTMPDAEGYTSEFFINGENSVQGVMYEGYSDAATWLVAHSKTGGMVGMVENSGVDWNFYHPHFAQNLHFVSAGLNEKTYPFNYLVWPFIFIQRNWNPPASWKNHIVHTINAGKTTYAVIMAMDPSTLTP